MTTPKEGDGHKWLVAAAAMVTALASLFGALAAAGVFGGGGDSGAANLESEPSATAPSISSLTTTTTTSTTDLDIDRDGVDNAADNCVQVANPGQANLDGDTQGDACDEDIDGDEILNAADNCRYEPGPGTSNGCPRPRGGFILDAPESVITDSDAPTSHPGIRIGITVVTGGGVELSGSGACDTPNDLSGGSGEVWQVPVIRLGTCEIVAAQETTATHDGAPDKVVLIEVTGR